LSQRPFIVTIAAVSGGGKTTITNILSGRLSMSEAIYFDDFDFDGPDDICEWVEQGAEYNEWNLTPIINKVQDLIKDKNKKYIIIDYPFSYLNKGMRDYIDFSIFIDTPLDIALARRLIRDFNQSSIESIHNELEHYQNKGRKAYLEMLNSVKPNSDVVIDGTLPADVIVHYIINEINNRILED